MSDLVRLSFSIEKSLLERLERMVRQSNCANRSKFIRDMIRERLVKREWECDQEVIGTITLIYDHHIRRLSERLTEFQHRHHATILVSTHVHLDDDICVEVLLARGKAENIKKIGDELQRQRGILHISLSLSSTGKNLL